METAVVYAGFMAFVTEMFAPLLLCSSIPLGSPPVQDPNLGKIAPKECIFYVGWAGIGTPDAKSGNRAERFLADPEIRHMRAEAARRFRSLIKVIVATNKESVGNAATIPPEFCDDADLCCELLVTRPCAGFISHLTQADNSSQPHGAFVVNVGDAGPKIAAMLKRYCKVAKGAIEERTVDGHIEYRLRTADLSGEPNSQASDGQAAQDFYFVAEASKARREPPPKQPAAQENPTAATNTAGQPAAAKPIDPNLRWSLRDKYLIVTCGDESPAKIIKRMKGPEPEWFVAVGKDLPIERRAAVVRFSLETLAANCDRYPECRDAAKQIRDTHLRAVTLVTGLGHDDFVSQLLVETDGIAGALLKTMVDRPLKAEDLAVIPRDATLAMALRVNPNLIATGLRWVESQSKDAGKNDESRSSVTTLDVQNFLMLMAQAPTDTTRDAITRLCRKPIAIGLDDEICGELAASLGDAWRLYTSRGEGSSIFNGMTAVVHVKDAGRLTKLFDKLAARKPAVKAAAKTDAKAADKAPNGGEENAGTWVVRKTRFADRDVYYLVRPQGESAGVLTWCLVKDELVWSLSPQNVKAYLLRQPGGSTLADEPAVTDALRDKQSPTLLMYEDSREMFRLTYPLMQGWATLAASQSDLPSDGIDPMLLPAAPTIAKYLRPAVSTVSVVPKGVQLTLHQSLPNGNLGATLYCVFCSMLPADYEGIAPAVGIPAMIPMIPAYSADPARRTQELIDTDAAPRRTHGGVIGTDAAPATASTGANAGNAVAAPCAAAPAPAPGPNAPLWNPPNSYAPSPSPGGYAPPPASAAVAPCVPGPVYPSTATPEAYRPANPPAPQAASAYVPSAAYLAGPCPAPSYGAPTPSAPPPMLSNPQAPIGPPGYMPIVVYVPMIYYVPMATAPGGAVPLNRLPLPYPPGYGPPSFAPPSYGPPTVTPSTCPPPMGTIQAPSQYPTTNYPAVAPPTSTPPTYSPTTNPIPPLPPSVQATPITAPTASPAATGWDPYSPPATVAPSVPCVPALSASGRKSASPPAAGISPESPPSTGIAPDFAALKGKRVAVVCRPLAMLHYTNANVGRELGQKVSALLQEQVPKAKVVDQRKVARWINENTWDEYPEVAKALKADMIVGIDLESFTLYAGQTLYQGKANVTIRVFDCKKNGKEVFRTSIPQCVYPPSAPIPASERTESEFRDEFVNTLALQIVRQILAHDPSPEPSEVSAPASNQEVAERIANRLRTGGNLSDYHIGVKFHDGTAWLRGRVATEEQRKAALRLAFEAPEVKSMVNELSIAANDGVQAIPSTPSRAEAGNTDPAEREAMAAVPSMLNPVTLPATSTAPPTFAAPVRIVPRSSTKAAGQATFTEKEGPCTLKRHKPCDEDVFTIEVGQKMHGTCKFYIDEFFGRTIINAIMSVKNASKERRNCQYYVAFFDKDGRLIGCANQGLGDDGLAPGNETSMGSCRVFLPDGMAETVASYKVRFYETDRMPTKKR